MILELSISKVWKSFSGHPVLRNCSFAFKNSGIYVLMGPNGSGKSTFLRISALLETPDSGDVNYSSGGAPVMKDLSLMRRITLVLPKIGVFNTTVAKNVAFGLKIRNHREREIMPRVEHALDFVGLLHKRNHKALTLSSGESQRLGIARALAIEPEIIFLDEPTASVDVSNTGIIEEIILKVSRQGRTIVMTTHDALQAKRLADTLLFMRDGQITERTD